MLTKVEEKSKKVESQISAPRFTVLSVPIKNAKGSPLVINAFSRESRETMREAQELGSLGKKRRKKDPKDFERAFQSARHISTEGWDGASCMTFRSALITACKLVGFKMTIGKLSIFIEADGISKLDGTPLVRIYGEPKRFEAAVRNATGVADIRIRPRWDEWSALLQVRFDSEQFSDDDVINLIYRAGLQCGICEGRPDSSNSFGQGWGLFEIDPSKGISAHRYELPVVRLNDVK